MFGLCTEFGLGNRNQFRAEHPSYVKRLSPIPSSHPRNRSETASRVPVRSTEQSKVVRSSPQTALSRAKNRRRALPLSFPSSLPAFLSLSSYSSDSRSLDCHLRSPVRRTPAPNPRSKNRGRRRIRFPREVNLYWKGVEAQCSQIVTMSHLNLLSLHQCGVTDPLYGVLKSDNQTFTNKVGAICTI